jgi:hypothetical protein
MYIVMKKISKVCSNIQSTIIVDKVKIGYIKLCIIINENKKKVNNRKQRK